MPANILVVEDESITALAIKHKLERLGYSIVAIESCGEDAIKKAGQLKPDLILMDIFLKGEIDGIEAAQKINENVSVPIVYLTAHFEDEILQKAKLSNPYGYINKPFSDADLKSSIEIALHKHDSKSELIDNTEKQAQKKLKNVQDRYKELFNNMKNGVAVFEVEDDGSSIIFKDINKASEEIDKIKKEDVIGRNVIEIFPKIKESGLYNVFKRVWKSGIPEHFPTSFYEDHRIVGWRENYIYKLPSGEIVSIYDDITERKKQEQELKESLQSKSKILESLKGSEKKYKDLTSLLPQIVCETDEDLKVTFFNDKVSDLTGYSPEELQGFEIVNMIVPEDRERALENIQKKIQGIEPDSHEYTLIRKDGSTFPVIVHSTPIIDNDEFKGLRSILVDINDLKNVQKSLEKSKEKYKALIEASPEAIIVTDSQGIINFVSSKALHLCAAKKYEDLIGKKILELISPQQREEVEDIFYKALDTDYRINSEYEFVKMDGNHFIGDINSSLIKNNDQIESVIFTLRDVTEIKQAKNSLKESEEKFRALSENSPDIISRMDKELRFIYINHGSNTMGLSSEELVGKKIDDIVPLRKISDTWINKSREVLKTGKKQDLEFELPSTEGLKVFHTYIIPEYNMEGKIETLLAVSHDITQRKKTEEKLHLEHQKLLDIIEFLPDATFVIDENKKVIAWNKAIEEMTDVFKKDILGKGNYEYSIPFSGNRKPILIDLIFLDEKEIESKYKYVKREGKTLFAESFVDNLFDGKGAFILVKASPLFDKDGNIVGAVETIKDMTKFKDAEKSLKISEAYYRTIFENTGTATLIVEEDTSISLVNSEFEKLTHYSKEEVERKKSWIDFVANEDDLKRMKEYSRIRLKNPKVAPKNYEFHLLDKNNDIKDVFTTVSPIPNTKKSLVSLLDITENKQSRKALQESVSKYRQLVENAQEGILSVDQNGIITFVNPKMAQILGYTTFQMLQNPILKFVHKEDVDELEKYLNTSDHELKGQYDFRLIKKDGNTIYTSIETSTIFDEDGSKKGILALIADITERKKAENALRENENYMKTILATVQTGMVIIDPKKDIIIDVNKAAVDLIGALKEDIIGKSYHDFIQPYNEDLSIVLDNLEGYLITASAKKIPIIKSVVPITLKGQECILESFIDIKELKELEESLKQSTEKYKALIEASPEAIIVTDSDGNIKFVSPKTLELYGFKYETIINKNMFEYIAPECQEKARKDMHKIAVEGYDKKLIYNFLMADGTPFIGEVNLSIIKNGEEEAESIIFVLRDITKIKNAEKQIKMANIYHRALIEASLDPLVTIGPDGKITDVNSATEMVTGYSRGELIGTDFSEYFTEPQKAKEVYKKVFKEGIVRNYELEIKNKNGEMISVSYNASVYKDNNGNVIGIFAAARDISELKKAEQNIKTSLKEKEVLLKEIHHRVKNNLQIISSLLSLQSNYINDDEALEVFSESQNRVKTMAMIHEKLYQSDSLIKINIGEYINDLTKNLFYNYKISPNMIKLYNNIDNIFFDINTAIPCGLIINELVTNCLKHAFPWFKTPKAILESSEDLEFGKYKVEIELKQTDDEYLLIIADNGVGFPEDIDFRNTKSLGLQLVNNLVKQLDGSIQLDTSEGTKFIIKFRENHYEEKIVEE